MSELTLKEKIEQALDAIRPQLQMDGGNVEFVAFDETTGELQVRMQGACHGCPMAQMTLQNGISLVVKEQVPEVKAVFAV